MKSLSVPGICLLFTCMLACNQSPKGVSSEGSKAGWKSLSTGEYRIEYPDNWELSQSGEMGTSFILFSPVSSDQDQFRENVNLIIQNLTGTGIDFEEFVEISEEQIRTVITDGNIIESKKVSEKGLSYQKIIYTGKQGIFNLKFEQYYWVEDNKAIILTLTCEEDQFDSFKEVGEEILNSFKTI